MVIFGSIAAMIHVAARSLLGRLKDDTPQPACETAEAVP
jgi:hypothetical protein